MGKGNKQSFARKRKRKGHGNQYTKQHCKYKKVCEKDSTNGNHNKNSNVGDCMLCTSAKKMKIQGNLQTMSKAMAITFCLSIFQQCCRIYLKKDQDAQIVMSG